MEKLRAIAIIQNIVKRFKKIISLKIVAKKVLLSGSSHVLINNRHKNSKTCPVAY